MELLPRLRNERSTKEDWELLVKRIPTQTNLKEFEGGSKLTQALISQNSIVFMLIMIDY